MTSKMMRAAAVTALLALFGTAGGCGVGRKAAQEALEAAARNSDEAAQHAMTAEEVARLGLDAGRVGAYMSYRRHQDGQNQPDQADGRELNLAAGLGPICPLNERRKAAAEAAFESGKISWGEYGGWLRRAEDYCRVRQRLTLVDQAFINNDSQDYRDELWDWQKNQRPLEEAAQESQN